jgi:hypothetical protein
VSAGEGRAVATERSVKMIKRCSFFMDLLWGVDRDEVREQRGTDRVCGGQKQRTADTDKTLLCQILTMRIGSKSCVL